MAQLTASTAAVPASPQANVTTVEQLRAHQFLVCSAELAPTVLSALGVSDATHSKHRLDGVIADFCVRGHSTPDVLLVEDDDLSCVSHLPNHLPPAFAGARHVVFVAGAYLQEFPESKDWFVVKAVEGTAN